MPIENRVQSENTAAVTNSTVTNHNAQDFFTNTVTAVMRLRMPIKPKCGAKPARGIVAKNSMPEIR